MLKVKRSVSTFLLLLLYLSPAAFSQGGQKTVAAAGAPDEAALRHLIEQYFAAYARKDVDGLLRLWSAKAEGVQARRRAFEELFAAHDGIEVKNLKATKVSVEGDKARARVEVETSAVEVKTGRPASSGFGKARRALQFIREGGAWKISAEVSAEEDLAASLAAAKTENERAALLAADKELLTVELRKALVSRGDRLSAEGSNARAIELFRLAQSIAEQIGDKVGAGDALIAMTQAFYAQSDYTHALEYLEKSLRLHESLNDKFGLARTLNGLSVTHRTLGNYDQALEYGQKSLALFEELGNKRSLLSVLINIGSIYFQQDKFDLALEYYRKPQLIAEELGDKFWLGLIFNNIGLVYKQQGNYALAMEYYLKSLRLKEEVNDRFRMAYTLDNIGIIYKQQGNYSLALEYHQRALKLSESLGNQRGVALALESVGDIYFGQGDYARATDYLQKALNIVEATGGKSNTGNLLYDLGRVSLAQGNQAQALNYFEKSLALQEEVKNQQGISLALVGLSEVSRSRGDYARAKELAERASDIAKQNNDLEELWEARVEAGRAYLGLDRPAPARQAFEEAIATIETVRSQVAGGEQERQRFFEDKISPYHQMVQLLVSQNNPGEALAYAEKAKARALLDVLQSGRVNIAKAMSRQEQERESQLKGGLALLNRQISRENLRESPDRSRLTDLSANLQKARLEYEAFRAGLYAAHPELKVRRGEARLVNLDEAGALLPDAESALLEYVVTNEKTYLLVLTSGGKPGRPVTVKSYTLDVKGSELAERVGSFRGQLARRELNFGEAARALHDLLLGAAGEELKGKTTLVIVPDGVLWELPFQALQTAAGHYLVEDCAISYAPSLTVLREMIKARHHAGPDSKTSASTLLAFGNPSLGKQAVERNQMVLMDENLAPLPEAEKLVNALPQLYGVPQTRVYTGAEAREDRAKTEAAGFRILQFATHGVLNDASPMYSYVLLSQAEGQNEDGLLEAWEMMNLNLRADLVVLSACETARGRTAAGEGMIGMSWALFVAGSPATLVSQWKVESASTTALMLEFHRQVKTKFQAGSKTTVAAALREAELKLLRGGQYRHPFYWAGFVLVGDGR